MAQDQGQPVARGELLEGSADVKPDVDTGVMVVGVSQKAKVGVRQMRDGLVTAQTVQTGVDHDPMQPCGDGGLTSERLGPPERGDERLLYGVGGHFRVAGGPQGQRPHPIAVAPEQLAEGVRVARTVCREHVAVGQPTQVVQSRHGCALS